MRAVQGDLSGKVITLKPQIDFRAATASARVLKEEAAIRVHPLQQPFGVKSTIERVTAKLEGKHWMFKGSRAPPRRHQDVRLGLPRRGDGRGRLRSRRQIAAAWCAPPRTICASARPSGTPSPKFSIDKTHAAFGVVSPHCSIRPCTSLLNSIYTYSKVLKSNGFC